MTPPKTYSVYGVTLETDLDLDKRLLPSSEPPDVTLECVTEDRITDGWHDAQQLLPPDGQEGPASIHRFGDHLAVRFAGASDYHIWNDRIVCRIFDADRMHLIPNQLLGLVLALWLEQQGILALHASAAVVNGGAATFLASKGGGKTSAVATFVKAGHPMLSEDLLAVEEREDRYLARPGYPQMRMWPQDAIHFGATPDALDRYHPSFSKRWVPIGSNGFGTFCNEPQPLVCIYVLERADDTGAGVEFTPIRPAESVLLLAAGSFMPDVFARERRFGLLGGLADAVPVRRLRYGGSSDHRLDLRDPILQDLATL